MKFPVHGTLLAVGAWLLATGTTGCIWNRMKMNDPEIVTYAKNIIPEKTKVSELKSLLHAEPTIKMPAKGGEQFVYTFSDSKSEGLMLLLVNFTKTTTTASSLFIEAGTNGIVKAVHIPHSPEPAWEFWPFGE